MGDRLRVDTISKEFEDQASKLRKKRALEKDETYGSLKPTKKVAQGIVDTSFENLQGYKPKTRDTRFETVCLLSLCDAQALLILLSELRTKSFFVSCRKPLVTALVMFWRFVKLSLVAVLKDFVGCLLFFSCYWGYCGGIPCVRCYERKIFLFLSFQIEISIVSLLFRHGPT